MRYFTLGAATGGFFIFFSVFRHRVVCADVLGAPFYLQEEHNFPTPEGFAYPSLGSFEDTPFESRLIRFALPRPTDKVIMRGVETIQLKVNNKSSPLEYFPIPSEDGNGYFDLLVWRERKCPLYDSHKIGDEVIARQGDIVYEYSPGSYDSIILFLDPSGIPPGIQLLREIRHRHMQYHDFPNVHLIYFKPPHWPMGTPLDEKLFQTLSKIRGVKKNNPAPSNEVTFQYSSTRPTRSIIESLEKAKNNTLVVAMCSHNAMHGVEREIKNYLKSPLKREGIPSSQFVKISTHELIV